MEDELWLKKIKDKLEDYSEPLPVAGWERLEKELSVSGAPITGPHRMIPFRRWAVAAAAVLLVAVSSVSLWLLQSPVGNEMRHTSVPALAVAPDVLPEQTVPAIRTNSIDLLIGHMEMHRRPIRRQVTLGCTTYQNIGWRRTAGGNAAG